VILDGFAQNLPKPTWSRNGSRIELRTRQPHQMNCRASPTHLEGSRGLSADPKNNVFRVPAEALISYWSVSYRRGGVYSLSASSASSWSSCRVMTVILKSLVVAIIITSPRDHHLTALPSHHHPHHHALRCEDRHRGRHHSSVVIPRGGVFRKPLRTRSITKPAPAKIRPSGTQSLRR
jgi:hypothetical protein